MNYYELLEVSPKASKEVIRAAYKSLMQRYHPDKNAAGSAMASRAALIVQAYDVLSDAEQRAAYDARLRSAPPAAARPRPSAARGGSAAPATRSNWYLWFLAVVILVSGSLLFSLSRTRPDSRPAPQPPTAAVAEPRVEKAQAGAIAARPAVPEAAAKAPSTRRIALLKEDLNVVLGTTDTSSQGIVSARHVLSIPAVSVEIGAIEADAFAKVLEDRRDELLGKLSQRLAATPYSELQFGGDKYLKSVIHDALREFTGTKILDDSAPAADPNKPRYGVVGVSLPSSFTLM